MSRSKYLRPELTIYKDPVVGGCASQGVSSAECSCDCATTECDSVTFILGCGQDNPPCYRCTDGSSCPPA